MLRLDAASRGVSQPEEVTMTDWYTIGFAAAGTLAFLLGWALDRWGD